MKLYTWYYNTRDSLTQDRWDFPVRIIDGKFICMISYVIDAHGEEHIDWSRYNDSAYNISFWIQDHIKNKPVENLIRISHDMIRDIFNA